MPDSSLTRVTPVGGLVCCRRTWFKLEKGRSGLERAAGRTSSRSYWREVPTRVLVPSSMVVGRCVLSCTVRQGTSLIASRGFRHETERTLRRPGRQPLSGNHAMRIHSDLRRPVEEIHEDDEAVLLVHLEDGGDKTVEGAAGHLHLLARLIWARRTDDGAIYRARLEAFDESIVKEARAVAAAHQRAHTVGREYRPPALKVRVHAHEQISGEERSQHLLRAPGVSYARAHHRAVRVKRLPGQVLECDLLPMRLRVHNNPSARRHRMFRPLQHPMMSIAGTHDYCSPVDDLERHSARVAPPKPCTSIICSSNACVARCVYTAGVQASLAVNPDLLSRRIG